MIAAILVVTSTLASMHIAYCRTCDYIWLGIPIPKDECFDISDSSMKFICDGTAGKIEFHSETEGCGSSSASTFSADSFSYTYVCASEDDTCEAYTMSIESYDSSTTCSGTASDSVQLPVISKTLGCEKVYSNSTEYRYLSWETTDTQVTFTEHAENCSTVMEAETVTEGCTSDEDGSSSKLSLTIISAAHQSFSCQPPLFYLALMVATYIFN